MWNPRPIKNKIYAVLLILIGALTIPIEWDATFFLFSIMMGMLLFIAKENWIYEGEEDHGTSGAKTYSEIGTEKEDRHLQSNKSTA